MKPRKVLAVCATAITIAAFGAPAHADYDSNPELRPENRCVTADGKTFAEAGIDPIHCQPLWWDLPAAVKVGTLAVSAPFKENRVPRWPHGISDRIPPMYILDANGDGASDNGEGYENPGPGRVRLCSDPDTIPTWEPVLDAQRKEVIGQDPTGKLHSVDDPTKLQSGPLVRVTCRRGYRAHFGPWQMGTDPQVYDYDFQRGLIRFENTNRLDRDAAANMLPVGADGKQKRTEWATDYEFYMHFSSHHMTCWDMANTDTLNVSGPPPCDDPKNPKPREAYDKSNPNAECRAYQRPADQPSDPMGEGTCNGGKSDPDCNPKTMASLVFRAGIEAPGRFRLQYPTGTGMLGVEQQLWKCDQHAVNQLPPGSYGMTKLANYRLQKGGLTNNTKQTWFDTPPGKVWGGTVGEIYAQYFTEAGATKMKPLNYMFNLVNDLATTAYPPFTWNYHETQWVAPYDLKMAFFSMHSHHRMVKGTLNVVPNPPRPNGTDPHCGGANGPIPPTDMYTNYAWEDAKMCYYWKEPDGALTLRKGQIVRMTCYVNNGVTPEAIKQGLVAQGTVESLRAAGVPIPVAPTSGPTSAWSGLVMDSPIGHEFLYGTHPPINYRVVYKCGRAPGVSAAGPVLPSAICDPNPAVDADGEYVDGSYANDVQCGAAGGYCNPANIVFANQGEDEMCIGVGLYYAMDRLGDVDGGGHDAAMANLTSGDPDRMQEVGTPGSLKNMDPVARCQDCEPGL
jgi:hypothetical protein